MQTIQSHIDSYYYLYYYLIFICIKKEGKGNHSVKCLKFVSNAHMNALLSSLSFWITDGKL